MDPDHTLRLKTDIEAINTQLAQGRLDEALGNVDLLLAKEPEFPTAWYLKGLISRRQGHAAPAITCFNQALNKQPDFKEACLGLAMTLEETGQILVAIKVYEHLLKIEQFSGPPIPTPIPLSTAAISNAETWFNKGTVLLKQGDHISAADAFRKVIAIHRDTPEALVNLGLCLHHLGQHEEAQKTLLQCLRLKPGFPPALNILGGSYGMSNKPLLGIAAWKQILAHDPNYFEAWSNLGKEMSRLECLPEALKAYEQALRIRPNDNEILPSTLHLLMRLCRWEKAESIKQKIVLASKNNAQWTEPFFVCVHIPEMQRDNAKRYADHFFAAAKPYELSRPLPVKDRANGKLRIGYVSSDLNQHATAYLISEMFEQHDRKRFEIFAYSHSTPDNSAAEARIKQSVDHFEDINALSDYDAAQMIRGHGIDILVDLKGYTRGMRLGISAQRPAPIQMHYLGFPGTMASRFLDYFITDSIVSPEGSDHLFTECLIRLPHSYQINDRKRPMAASNMPRSAYGLPKEGLVFCDFNNSYKITPEIFAVWMRLLQQVENSVLWLYETYSEATNNLKEEAKKHGVDPNRIVVATKAPLMGHMARYRHADIFLDTFPCTGHTTASDALWCGVPVITMAGESFVSRVAASLLHAAGLPGLVAPDLAGYEALALSLAHDEPKRMRYKRHLEDTRMDCPLFDSAATTKSIEAAYLQAAKRHSEGLPPLAFAVTG